MRFITPIEAADPSFLATTLRGFEPATPVWRGASGMLYFGCTQTNIDEDVELLGSCAMLLRRLPGPVQAQPPAGDADDG